MDNTTKEQRTWIIVTIVTVTILIFIFTGITYAYFTSNDNTGSTAQIITDSGKMTINYADDGSNLLVSSNISPSNNIVADKTFTLTGLNTASAGNGLSMPYKVGIKYVSSFSGGQIHYYIKKVSSTIDTITTNYTGETNTTIVGHPLETGYSHGTLDNGNKYTELVTGNFPSNKNEQTITFNLKLQFPDTGTNQDTEKNRTINAEVVVNYEDEGLKNIATTITKLYDENTKDENGITLDGLQKDGTGDFNVTLLNSSNKNYNMSLLSDSKLIADTENDEYDNLRYVGLTPNNYISFNNEVWRIIGVFNVVNGDSNNVERVVKIVRNDPIGEYAFDNNGGFNNDSYGLNDWSQAVLMKELNGDYLNTSLTSNPLWIRNTEFNINYVIKSEYQEMINNSVWNYGGINYDEKIFDSDSRKSFDTTSKELYILEKQDLKYQDSFSSSWTGKIGLISASDFTYASSSSGCHASVFADNGTCSSNNWMLNTYSDCYTMTPLIGKNIDASGLLMLISRGFTYFYHHYGAYTSTHIRPALYLKSDVKIISGEGSEENPFIISI